MEKVKRIEAEALRQMEGKEGLILQGCGGNLSEWVEGINDLLREEGILLESTEFSENDCLAFVNDGLTCLLFPFSGKVKLDMGRLAVWRIVTYEGFGGTWLSDYVENRLSVSVGGEPASEEKGMDMQP